MISVIYGFKLVVCVWCTNLIRLLIVLLLIELELTRRLLWKLNIWKYLLMALLARCRVLVVCFRGLMLGVIRIFDLSLAIWIVEKALKIQNEFLVDWW